MLFPLRPYRTSLNMNDKNITGRLVKYVHEPYDEYPLHLLLISDNGYKATAEQITTLCNEYLYHDLNGIVIEDKRNKYRQITLKETQWAAPITKYWDILFKDIPYPEFLIVTNISDFYEDDYK